MTEQKIKGTLAIVAKTAGIQIEGRDGWINPTKEAREEVLKNLDALKAIQGKPVIVKLETEGVYHSIQVDDGKEEPQKEEPKHETGTKTTNTGSGSGSAGATETTPLPIPYQDRHMECTDMEYFGKLNKIKCETKNIQVGNTELTYTSWAEAWQKLKEQYPESRFHVHENANGMPYFADQTGGFVKVSVTVANITHTVHLPIMDYRNQSIKRADMNTFEINKNIQRAFTKAIALHGVGLYVYKGIDLPTGKKD